MTNGGVLIFACRKSRSIYALRLNTDTMDLLATGANIGPATPRPNELLVVGRQMVRRLLHGSHHRALYWSTTQIYRCTSATVVSFDASRSRVRSLLRRIPLAPVGPRCLPFYLSCA